MYLRNTMFKQVKLCVWQIRCLPSTLKNRVYTYITLRVSIGRRFQLIVPTVLMGVCCVGIFLMSWKVQDDALLRVESRRVFVGKPTELGESEKYWLKMNRNLKIWIRSVWKHGWASIEFKMIWGTNLKNWSRDGLFIMKWRCVLLGALVVRRELKGVMDIHIPCWMGNQGATKIFPTTW